MNLPAKERKYFRQGKNEEAVDEHQRGNRSRGRERIGVGDGGKWESQRCVAAE